MASISIVNSISKLRLTTVKLIFYFEFGDRVYSNHIQHTFSVSALTLKLT
jgi:hypothetical protein